MSVTRTLTCDGCGASVTVSVVRSHYRLPLGWLRLRVSGYPKPEAVDMKFLGQLEVCSPDCAPRAIVDLETTRGVS